jgi:hypothetical protein
MLSTYDVLIIFSSVGALLCLIALVRISQYDYYDSGYKQGQIDAINNKIKYKLSINEDGEKVWTKINTDEA